MRYLLTLTDDRCGRIVRSQPVDVLAGQVDRIIELANQWADELNIPEADARVYLADIN